MFAKFVLGVFFLASIAAANVSVNLIVSARDLPNMDIADGAPDVYVKVFKAEGSSEDYLIVGQTKIIDNTNNPDWPEVFNFNYIVGGNQRLRFEVWDYDFDWDDYMGYVTVPLQTIVEIAGELEIDIVSCPKPTCGRLRLNRQLNGEITVNMDSRFINPKTVIVAP